MKFWRPGPAASLTRVRAAAGGDSAVYCSPAAFGEPREVIGGSAAPQVSRGRRGWTSGAWRGRVPVSLHSPGDGDAAPRALPCAVRSPRRCRSRGGAGPGARKAGAAAAAAHGSGFSSAVGLGTLVSRAGAGSALPCSAPGDRSGPRPSAAPDQPGGFGAGPVSGRGEQGSTIPARLGQRRPRGSCGAGRVLAAAPRGFHLEEFGGAVERGSLGKVRGGVCVCVCSRGEVYGGGGGSPGRVWETRRSLGREGVVAFLVRPGCAPGCLSKAPHRGRCGCCAPGAVWGTGSAVLVN